MTDEIIDEIDRHDDKGAVVIRHIYPPIPIRNFDYEATRVDYEPGMAIGHGATPDEAYNDLIAAEELRA
jgi:hypothetical protein